MVSDLFKARMVLVFSTARMVSDFFSARWFHILLVMVSDSFSARMVSDSFSSRMVSDFFSARMASDYFSNGFRFF